MSDAPSTAVAPRIDLFEDGRMSPRLTAAIDRGDITQVVPILLGRDDAARLHREDPRTLGVINALLSSVRALREERVTHISNDEAFVLRTGAGSLRRVMRNVRLSIAAGHLWQMTQGREKRILTPGIASLTVAGLREINKHAGVTVGMAPTVMVDGVERSNPYVERTPDVGGQPGTVRRIVIAVIAAGLTESGTPVVVRAVTEFEPMHELRHALLKKLYYSYNEDGSRRERDWDMVPEAEVESWKAANADRGTWMVVPLFGGLCGMINVASKGGVALIQEHMQVNATALSKAQTVAERNALRRHPSLSFPQVQIDQSRGEGFVRVVGWAPDERSAAQFQAAMQRLARGSDMQEDLQTLVGSDVEIIDATETHAPANEAAELPEDGTAVTEDVDANVPSDIDVMRRNALIAELDDHIAKLSPAAAKRVVSAYNADTATTDELQALRDRLVGRGGEA